MTDTTHAVLSALAVTLIAAPLWWTWRRTEPRLAPWLVAAGWAGLRWHGARAGFRLRQSLATVGEFLHPQRFYAADDAVVGWADEMANAATVELPAAKPWRDAPPVPDDWRCPHCGFARCRAGREGRDCTKADETEHTAYSAAVEVSRRLGRHTCRYVSRAWARRDRLHQLRDMVGMAPGHYAGKLGRPVMLPRGRVVLP